MIPPKQGAPLLGELGVLTPGLAPAMGVVSGRGYPVVEVGVVICWMVGSLGLLPLLPVLLLAATV
jgi:hypothetical protein